MWYSVLDCTGQYSVLFGRSLHIGSLETAPSDSHIRWLLFSVGTAALICNQQWQRQNIPAMAGGLLDESYGSVHFLQASSL